MRKRTKVQIVVFFFLKKRPKRGKGGEGTYKGLDIFVLERECNFSLELREIRLSAAFGTRRKDALRGAGYAWTPDLRSFDKLLEVGVSPYLGFILSLSTMLMFRLVEALNGRLIGPKPWDRIDIIFGTPNGAAVN